MKDPSVSWQNRAKSYLSVLRRGNENVTERRSQEEEEAASSGEGGGICYRVIGKGLAEGIAIPGWWHRGVVTGRESRSEVIENGAKLLLEW
jgi:hypothetical protein